MAKISNKNILNELELDSCILEMINENTFKLCNNEEELRQKFQNEINQYARVLGLTSTYLNFFNETRLKSGRCDFLYGNTIIEYKKYNRLNNMNELDKAREQLFEYLTDEQYRNLEMYGFLFDGVLIEFYKKAKDDKVEYVKMFSGEVNYENINNLLNTLFENGRTILSPMNIQYDFSLLDRGEIVKNSNILDLFKDIYTMLLKKNNKKTDLLYLEWEKLFKLSEKDKGKSLDVKKRIDIYSQLVGTKLNRDDEYKVLFSLHTTLNIIIKLIMVKSTNYLGDMFINKKRLRDFYTNNNINEIHDFISTVEKGEYFNQVNIMNLVDCDFFSWYLDEIWSTPFIDHLKLLMMSIDKYDFKKTVMGDGMLGDLFKGLYENFIPKVVRHSFGEYHTPSYLVKDVLKHLNLSDKDYCKNFIDPCCGSGTFILEIYNNKYKTFKHKVDFEKLYEGIVGADINPISTLITKANIFVNSIDKVTFDIRKKYEIPIYNCDSLYVPEKKNINGLDCYYYSLYTTTLQTENKDNIKLILPVDLVNDNDFFSILEKLEEYIVKKDIKSLMLELSKHVKNIEKIKDILEENFNELIELEKKGLNSIWLKIFSNYFKLASYETFDYIIGNPAWVRWGDLPENYRINVKNNVEIKNIFSSDKNSGGIDLNFCALLSNKCIERWFKDDSKLAYLMPKSIIYNKSFEGFRKLDIKNKNLYFEKIYDYSNCGEIFEGTGNMNFCLYLISNKGKYELVPFNKMKKIENSFEISKVNKLINLGKYIKNNNFLELEAEDEINEYTSLIGECKYTFRKGVEAKYPMRFVFSRDKDENLAYFYPIIKPKKLYEIDKSREILLEKRYMTPLITSPVLKTSWENLYVIFLYENMNKKPIDIDKVKEIAPYIYKWLEINKTILSDGSNYNKRIQNKPYWGLLRIGDYSFKDIFVCIRDNTTLNPRIIQKIKTHWNEEKTPIFDGHISYISYSRKISDKLSEKEAKNIYNILKDKKVLKIILNSQSSRSISSNIPIKIEYFDKI